MAATAQSGRRGDDLVSGTPFDLGSAQTTKPKTRVPEILLGTFLIAVFALAGAWFYSTSTQSESFVGLRTTVQRGQEIQAADLIRFEVNGDERIVAIEWRDAATIVGKLAAADLTAGTLLTPGYFTDQADIADGFGIVGLSLDVGEYPTSGIRAGDWVRVIAVPPSSAGQTVPPPETLVARAQIVEVAALAGTGRFVSLTTETAVADLIASVESEGRVRLIQIQDTGAGGAPDTDTSAEEAETEGEDG